jgi:flagellar hook-associated protein 2
MSINVGSITAPITVSGITGTTFTGSSAFSSDLQQVISRAVQIASLPIAQLVATQTQLNSEKTELSTISSSFASLQSAIQSLQNATSAASLSTSLSSSNVSVSLGAQATPGSYSISVTNLGSYSAAISNAGATAVTDPSTQGISSDSSFTLTVNGTAITITPSATTLNALANAINSQAGGSVQATIINFGSTASPDYRLSLQSTQLAPDSIQLSDSSSDLLSANSTGSPATYQLNGLSTTISSSSRTITLAPGVTVNLLAQNSSGTSTTITLASNTSAVSNALANFVNAYNNAVSALDNDRGQNTGALNGQGIISSLSQALQQLVNYSSSSGAIQNLAGLGVSFNSSRQLHFDQSTFYASVSANSQAMFNFLGSTTSGYLGNAINTINSIENSDTGILATESHSLANQLTTVGNKISSDQDQINTLQTNLTNQMAAADAMIASLEQRVAILSGLFSAEQTNAQTIANG